ncbi:MAG: hypothetical protein ABI557_13745, partial [Aureliella sp.]
MSILFGAVSGSSLHVQQGIGTLPAYAAIAPQTDPVLVQSNTERPPRPQRATQTGAATETSQASRSESARSIDANARSATPVDAAIETAAPSMSSLDPEWLDTQTKVLLGVVLVTLGIASLVGQYLRRQP